MAYWIAGFFGGIVGAAELVSRYKDAPARLFQIASAWLYIFINVAASVGALYVIHVAGWTFGQNGKSLQHLYQVSVAGFGSIAFFRSSLFSVKVGDSTVPVGPNLVLTPFLNAAEQAVGRDQANERIKKVSKVMSGVDYAKAHLALPAECFTASVDVAASDQQTFRSAISVLDGQSEITSVAKANILGLQLMNLVGYTVLEAAVSALDGEIK